MHISYNEYILVSAEKKTSGQYLRNLASPKTEKGVIKLQLRF